MLFFRYLLFFICAFTLNCTQAQNLMNIHQGNGTLIQIPLESIDSVRFVTLPPPTIQKIFQSNGNILSIAVNDIDSITYTLPNIAALASLTTQPVTVLSSSSAYSGGTISSDGGSAILQRGVCWSTSPNPTLSNNFSVDGTGIGSFGSNVVPLQSATVYYLRAYAINSEGTAYGNQLSFTTLNPSISGSLATITTSTVLNTIGLTASCGGNITADGGLAVTARGVCWAIGTTPTINNNITSNGAGGGSFTSTLTNLLPNTSYFVRAYATNDAGTAYGITYSLTTFTLPTVITNSITSITVLTAISGGIITSDGGSAVTQRGVCWSTSPNPTTANNLTSNGSGMGNFTSNISGLTSLSTYYVRAYAINIVGVSYGNELTFSTIALLASVSTNPISTITTNTAISGGNIIYDGGAAVTQRGVCWSNNPNPTISNNLTSNGSGTGNFTSNISGLPPATTYYVRAYAINTIGISYGNELTFSTIGPGAGVTFDGYIYPSIVLGNGQEWMSENLRTTIFANGDIIPNVIDDIQWDNLTTGAWCHYNNDNQFENPYGKLYNGYTVVDVRNVCPNSWHVPTDDEWFGLINYLGGLSIAGDKMKSTGTQYWYAPNTNATNESGFSGLPGGSAQGVWQDVEMNGVGHWWSSTLLLPNNGIWFYSLGWDIGSVLRSNAVPVFGMSVRCLKD
jgi:uncharacterized protein (TIGR02145 family)